MKVNLTPDEVQALQGIQSAYSIGFAAPIVPGSSKRLVESGYVRLSSDGHLSITEVGRQALFQKRCLTQLLAFSKNQLVIIQLDCQEWLCESGYLRLRPQNLQLHSFDFEVTQKGRDWVATAETVDG
jgi:hypothetical protein